MVQPIKKNTFILKFNPLNVNIMLEHQMIVLNGVKEYSSLFKKELYKTIKWLNEKDLKDMYKWLKQNFYTQYSEVIEEAFHCEHELAY